MTRYSIPAAAAALLCAAAPASALIVSYTADLKALGPTAATGTASLMHDTVSDMLSVSVLASGLEDGVHLMHIHGRFGMDGAPANSVTPTVAEDDLDGDGFVELLEGLPKYGPILLPLTDADGMFPTSVMGALDFSANYDLTDPAIFNEDFTRDDLFPLTFREVVVHGGFNPPGVGAGTPGEIDGEEGFKVILPVLSGEIEVVDDAGAVIPLPAAAWLLLGGVGALGGMSRLRRKRTA